MCNAVSGCDVESAVTFAVVEDVTLFFPQLIDETRPPRSLCLTDEEETWDGDTGLYTDCRLKFVFAPTRSYI